MSVSEISILNYGCNNCGGIYVDKRDAEACCKVSYCECGEPKPKYKIRCEVCAEKNSYEKAEKVHWKDYKGEFVYDHLADKYFSNLDSLVEYYELKDLELPKYVYACEPQSFSLDIESIVENDLIENHYEDAYQDIEGIDELIEFVDSWCKKQEITSYYRLYDTIILLD